MIPKAASFLSRFRNASLVFSMIVGFALSANAQVVGSSRGSPSGGGNHSIQGRIYFPAGQPVNSKVVRVNLETNNSVGGCLRCDANVTPQARTLLPKIEAFEDLNVRTIEEVIVESAAQPRDRALLLGVFAAVALILTAVGIYGLMSYFVKQRTQELAFARPRDVLKLVVRQGMVLTLIGTIKGMVASFWLTRLMKGLLFGIIATDVGTFSTASGGLILVALLACYVPARRATKVDPLVALRYE